MARNQDDPYDNWCLRLARRRRRKTRLERAVREMWRMSAKKRDVTTALDGTVEYIQELRSE